MDTGNSIGGGVNPEINRPNPEQPIQMAPAGFEQLPQMPNIEAPVEIGRETEQSVTQGELQPVIVPAQPIPQAPQPQTRATHQTPVQADKLPQVAKSSGRIEKEWVAKGEKIFAETQDDPHSQKERIDDLRDEYQAVRYGREEDAV